MADAQRTATDDVIYTNSHVRWVLDYAQPLPTNDIIVIERTTTDRLLGGPFKTVKEAEKFIASLAVRRKERK